VISPRTLWWRAPVIVFGLIGILWGSSEFSMLRRETTISNIVRRVIDGDSFKSQVLLDQASFPEEFEQPATCRPLTLRNAAILRIRIAEISDNSSLAPELVRKNSGVDAIRRSLGCSPADPFLWLVLFALEPSGELSYLSASYRLGRNEGWIALKRNPAAFAVFDELPEDLRGTVVQEFLRILEMDHYDEAMKIFVGPAWDKKELILSRMDHISIRHRQNLAVRLAAGGYDVIIPGTATKNTP
jgi:hypothetical protein